MIEKDNIFNSHEFRNSSGNNHISSHNNSFKMQPNSNINNSNLRKVSRKSSENDSCGGFWVNKTNKNKIIYDMSECDKIRNSSSENSDAD